MSNWWVDGKWYMDAPIGSELRLPLVVVEPSVHHGSNGAIRIADADHRIVCEIVTGGRNMADMFVAKMNALP